MEANIIKEIKIEKRDLPTRSPVYREAIMMGVNVFALKDGEMPPEFSTTYREKVYERMSIINPETAERKEYYVNVDERKLWNEITKVSDGFINSKIADGVRHEREYFFDYEVPKFKKSAWNKGVQAAAETFAALPWYKRLFYSPCEILGHMPLPISGKNGEFELVCERCGKKL